MAVMKTLAAFFRVQENKIHSIFGRRKRGLPEKSCTGSVRIQIFAEKMFGDNNIAAVSDHSVGFNEFVGQQKIIIKIGLKLPEHINGRIDQIYEFISGSVLALRLELQDENPAFNKRFSVWHPGRRFGSRGRTDGEEQGGKSPCKKAVSHWRHQIG
jgi:hypothetical protein